MNYKVKYWEWNEKDYLKHVHEAFELDSDDGYWKGYNIKQMMIDADTPEDAGVKLVQQLIEKGGVKIEYICNDGTRLDYADYILLNGKAYVSISVEVAPRHSYGYGIENLIEKAIK